ncbi:MAG: general secretion pathway protein GspF, partial [Gammaproteobacteria bacterium]|nr:general secretion pathway protein GspF [Gammaproteobacteria bacterium]
RRDFLRQGFITGTGVTLGGSVFSLFSNPLAAQAALSGDIQNLFASNDSCDLGASGGNIPFICFDLAGGSNMIGSNVLAGGQGGYLNDPISAAGYSKMGIPGGMVPGIVDAASAMSGPNNDFIDTRLGLPFHSDSGFLRGILEKISIGTVPLVNGAVIPARSDNDTGNNPHNPMYGIAATGSVGSVVTLIGSRSSESGGNSVAPAMSIDPSVQPTKVDRPSDVTGMVDTGDLTAVLTEADAKAVMESIARLSDKKIARITADTVVKDLVNCGYLSAADIADRFVGVEISPDDRNASDPINRIIVNNNDGIFSEAEFDGDGEFRKTASVMKMVIDGYAGAGTITMGGFDYHTGDRSTGERRDLRAGRCMGACLEYAARRGQPLMMYVFSDGSVASNGATDGTDENDPGRGKGEWTGDNSSTAGSFFLVYNPAANGGQAALFTGDNLGAERHQQIGWFRSDGSVETASSVAANNVNLLVNTVVLNYLALHGADYRDVYRSLFPGNDLGTDAHMMSLTAFNPVR